MIGLHHQFKFIRKRYFLKQFGSTFSSSFTVFLTFDRSSALDMISTHLQVLDYVLSVITIVWTSFCHLDIVKYNHITTLSKHNGKVSDWWLFQCIVLITYLCKYDATQKYWLVRRKRKLHDNLRSKNQWRHDVYHP